MAELLYGKEIAEKIKNSLKQQITNLKDKYDCVPALCAVQVGENPASSVYLRAQQKNADNLGINYKLHTLDAGIDEKKLIDFILNLNADDKVNGIILQLPLPASLDAKKIISFFDPIKDVEGMHPENLGKIILDKAHLAPCTACAAIEILNSTGIDFYGKEAVVVGHSEIVGKPLALMLLNKFATTTVCHIATGERGLLQKHVETAEILIVAVGKANLISGSWVREGAIVVDIGINRLGDKLVGDVEFDGAQKKAAYITPVPGGVGPVTVAILMRNLVEAAKLQLFKRDGKRKR
ncbi:MAG: bifunctional 5,10-methylenetetrahydrofolate dehydrogenase/5,10-methenyltetrahydrofolate cyclohydrolase [Candidatus Omnitrophica bacterium]|nr:bifunctional 5,10-methylenetetrahydrofolate dehydrogenase/5,10-methenyltetrahydrofolate cyclohydrolase [Candidatus Omnitrophota bacterium]MBU1925247.1 bifunctional 5,10-methylenetetrahydrofolate dehydrogenase/5,10-methenyltetrahydrofolate cyclohydrolase [Candidatus Omnitrophota bacterium]